MVFPRSTNSWGVVASQPHSHPCRLDADLELRRTRARRGGQHSQNCPGCGVVRDHLASRGAWNPRVWHSLGSCVQAQLRSKAASHRVFFERIPAIQDLQSAWLLFLFCASPRANFFLSVLHPISSQAFVDEHDQDIWRCFITLGQASGFDHWELASVPQCLGAVRRAQHQTNCVKGQRQTAWACSVNDTGE